jgi:hypothetical protein
MDSARWEQVQALFHEAADRPVPQRLPFLKAASGGDERLIADVLALLEEDARSSSLLDRGVAQVAGQMLGQMAVPSRLSQEFGPYRIRELLGEGGMGVVYLAEREDLGNLVAIKLLDAPFVPCEGLTFIRRNLNVYVRRRMVVRVCTNPKTVGLGERLQHS